MVDRNTAKTVVVVLVAAVAALLAWQVFQWLFRLLVLAGAAAFVAVVAYVAYRSLSWGSGDDGGPADGRTTETADSGVFDDRQATDAGPDDAALSDEEFERELEQLTEDG